MLHITIDIYDLIFSTWLVVLIQWQVFNCDLYLIVIFWYLCLGILYRWWKGGGVGGVSLLVLVSWGGCRAGSAAVILYPPGRGLHSVLGLGWCLGCGACKCHQGGFQHPHWSSWATLRRWPCMGLPLHMRGAVTQGAGLYWLGRVTSHTNVFASMSPSSGRINAEKRWGWD